MVTLASVVVPAFNAEKTLAECLNALCNQDCEDAYEIIVVDDGSRDGTQMLAQSFDVRVLGQQNKGAGAARNAGVAVARGEWIAFTDADCVPSRSWLRSLLAAGAQSSTSTAQCIGAGGRTLGLDSTTDAAQFCDLIGSLDAQRHLSHPKFPFAPSSNLMYRKSILEHAGGFDERYTSYEACDLHNRILKAQPGEFVYASRAVVFHRHRADWKGFWRQQYSYGKGYAQFVLHHRDECRWTIGDELKEWADIGRLSLSAWRVPNNERFLYARGMFVKKLAQRVGFVATQLDRRERARW